MSEKNLRTPRTIADCEFVVGYPIVQQEKPNEWRMTVICIGIICGLLWILK